METKTDTDQMSCVPREIVLKAAMIRLDGVDDEVEAGYNIVRRQHKTVTMFGSARTPENDPYYEAARSAAYNLAQHNYSIITGGGRGIMEAGNRGAKEADGSSIGFNIALPHEQTLNEYTTESYGFSHFAPRKIVMTLYADAYVYFPGGFGTLDELTEILTLIQTGKIPKSPILLYGTDFWSKLDAFIKETMLIDERFVSFGDELLYTITDDIDEIVRQVRSNKTYCNH